MARQPGDTAPDFNAETTEGNIRFYDWMENSRAVLFLHPKDFTPGCSTDYLYRCWQSNCIDPLDNTVETQADNFMREIVAIKEERLQAFPGVCFICIKTDKPETGFACSLIRYQACLSVTPCFPMKASMTTVITPMTR